MGKQQVAIFREAHPEPPFWAIQFELPAPPTAGCFLLLDLGGPIREVLFPTTVEPTRFTSWVPPRHPATSLLPGTRVDVIGPLGHGFHIQEITNLLLVAEANTLPPLLPLLQAAPSVTLLLEAHTQAQLPSPHHFPPAVEIHILTHDGSAGHAGTLDDASDKASPLFPLLQWAEQVCLSCRPERYPSLADQVKAARFQTTPDFAQALVQVPMPCGTGACEVCRIETRRGERQVCSDGPVFDLLDLATGR